MWNPFKTKQVAPTIVPTDTVLPLYSTDDNFIFRSVSINLMLKFDDVLDPELLRSSLERLIGREGWRKLGARLRLNDNGKLDYHVPQKFDEKRPAFAYTHVVYEVGIEEHPLASKLPKPSTTNQPAVFADPARFQVLARPENGARYLADYLVDDVPALGLHIVSFRNATLVSIAWLHALLDAVGMKALLSAWSLELQGRHDELPVFHGFDSDPLNTFGGNIVEPFKLANRQMNTWQMVVLGIRMAFESLLWGEEGRMLCVPASYLKSLREQAIEDAAQEAGGEKPFLSEGDVLCAWFTRFALSHFPTSNKTVLLRNAIDLRPRLADDLIPKGSAYCANAVLAIHTFLPIREIMERPIGHVALALRQGIVELGTRPQLEALASISTEAYAKTGYPPLFGDATMHMINYTNWSKAKLYETDFSAAVAKNSQPSSGRLNKPGLPSYIQPCGTSKVFSLRDAASIVGKDAMGNYWISGIFRKGQWENIEEALKNSPE